jgi:hypothetical protein
MRVITIRAAALLVLLAITLATGSIYALAQDEEAAAICPAGHLGLTLRWADAQDSLLCAVTGGLNAVPAEVVGLVVRGPDGTIVTIGVAPADTAAVVSTTDTPTATSSSSVRSTSTSSSSSSSTTCVNGQCTTSRNQVVCVDGSCSSHP